MSRETDIKIYTVEKQLLNPDMRVSLYETYAYLLKKLNKTKSNGEFWKWWELKGTVDLEGQVELKESE